MVKVMTTTPVSINQVIEASCVYCGEGHLFNNCFGNLASVNYGATLTDRTKTILIQTLKILDGDSAQTGLLNHLDFTNKIKGKKTPAMINSVLLKPCLNNTLRKMKLATTLSNRPQGSLPSNTEDHRREGKDDSK